MGFPEQFVGPVSTPPPASQVADAVDTTYNSESDSEPIFDRRKWRLRRHLAVETPEGSEHTSLDTNVITRDLPEDEEELVGSDSDSESIMPTPGSSRELSELSAHDVPPCKFASTLIYPRSQYARYLPPLPICEERVAVQELMRVIEEDELQTTEDGSISDDGEQFVEFDLTEFAVYLPPNRLHSYELRGLQDFASKAGCSSMLFDGILCSSSERRYVQGVPFEICSIGNYGKEFHTVGREIWIQSKLNKKSDLYYRLNEPSQEYQRFLSDFLWLADLAKHFVDYCDSCEENGKSVSVHNFREDFSQWLLNCHRDSADFQKWYSKYRGNDFRPAISANIDFLFKESIGVKDKLRRQPIWGELLDKNFIPAQKIVQTQTIVTPYIYECFRHLRFGQYLKSVVPASNADNERLFNGNPLHLIVANGQTHPVVEIPMLSNASSTPSTQIVAKPPILKDTTAERRKKIKAIREGDVLSVKKDKPEEGSVWKDEVSQWNVANDCWYIYVQGVHESDNNGRSFDGLWLYKSSDTSCAKMKYPYHNELFLSDNCTCKKGKMRGIIKEANIIDVVAVAWQGRPSCKGLFIRQTYLENDRFVTLENSHKKCQHSQSDKNTATSKPDRYRIGQTILVAQTDLFPPCRTSKYGLDPYEIIEYEFSNSREYAVLRRLIRRKEMEGQTCKPNELVYSGETVKVESSKIDRTCLVRFYNVEDMTNQTIPAPYSRDGKGNAFFITSRLTSVDGELVPIGIEPPESLIQGFDPSQRPSRKKLRGLDLYCGGGNFGRGLEEGQAVRNEWAVDMDKIAIHTYFANLLDPEGTHLYFGSVNDHLFQALQGNPKNSSLIPRPGEVEFISAGSPCQGFSNLNSVHRHKEKGLRNQSMVASVAAYIDFYRPKYGLLENVLTMAQKGKERDHDVLSQLICAIVGMGYQLSIFNLDAWSYGSPQSRSRIFVAFTAPGCKPIPHPELSHSHPRHVGNRGLGLLANGQSFGKRRHDPTPFNFVTASKAVNDLPYLGDAATHTCIPYPDHVLNSRMSKELTLQIPAIPTFPRKMNFWKAWNDGKGVMTEDQRALFPPAVDKMGNARQRVLKGSKAWERIDPNGLFGTVVVTTNVQDSRIGILIHWDQNRPRTVMEARRGQSFLDDDVIVGNPNQRMKIVGNSVDRSVSLALGLALREAWEENPVEDDDNTFAVLTVAATASAVRYEQSSFSKKSPGSLNCSSESPAETASENVTGNSARSTSSPVLGRDSHGNFSKNNQAKLETKPTPNPISSSTLGRDGRGRFSRQNVAATSTMPKGKADSSSLNRVIRDSYSLDNKSLGEDNRKILPNPLALEPTRKRPYDSLALEPSEGKSFKATKISTASSPNQNIGEAKLGATSTLEANRSQQLGSQPVNATDLSQKLQVISTLHVVENADSFATADDKCEESREFDFRDYSNRDEEWDEEGIDEDPKTKIKMDEEGLPVPPPRQSAKGHRIITTSNRGKGKSPTKARPKPQYVIDLTSDSEGAKSPPRPLAKYPVRPAVVLPKSKYVPVANNPLSAYAQTYWAKNFDQKRKHGPKR